MTGFKFSYNYQTDLLEIYGMGEEVSVPLNELINGSQPSLLSEKVSDLVAAGIADILHSRKAEADFEGISFDPWEILDELREL